MVNLPRYYIIADSAKYDETIFFARYKSHLKNGARLIQLRMKDLSRQEYEKLALQAIELSKKFNSYLILNCEVSLAKKLDADGVHLSSSQLMNAHERPLPREKLISAACHDSEQLKHAESIGIDFVTLSPVLPTKTHPDATPLGWNAFAQLCQQVKIPIYALGGMTEKDLGMALNRGAQGIAAIRSLWHKQY